MFKSVLTEAASRTKNRASRKRSLNAISRQRALMRIIGRFEQLESRNLLAAAFPQFIDPHAASGNQFGSAIVALSTGNVVITSPNDDAGGSDAGAVYLFSGETGALISTITGSHANDHIGSGGVTALTNGNFVISSNQWDNGAVTDAGAVTFVSGTTGISGTVGVANSLVGLKSNDSLNSSVIALPNGNYVVVNPSWDNNSVVDAGAVTFGNGTTGVSGAISATNSLVGSTASDGVGGTGVTILTNGNYVVRSSNWDNAAIVNAGAVTFGDGSSGVKGVINSSTNSLVGSIASDQIGNIGVTALTNGNYVVASSLWNNSTLAEVGATTFGSGTAGVKGTISTSNSLIGSTAFDRVGNGNVKALTNGNYVVISSSWDNAAIVNAGAVTFGDGVSGVKGIISSSTNSLVGSTANDSVGNRGVTALTNGNYVVSSGLWDNSGVVNTGAVTFGNGSSGVIGIVSATNSLVGTTANDSIGDSVTALSNGNYVVTSPSWDKGALTDAGAVTFGNGTLGKGAVSAANSLTGNTLNDQVGFGGVTALTNGNYIVGSPRWDSGSIVNAGAATFGNGTSGISGIISASNSLVGTTANDGVGDAATALSNGNYVIRSGNWNNGAATSAGAATFGNGASGITGAVSTLNSLVGSNANDNIGFNGVFALNNGNYVVQSGFWDNGTIADAGAATFGNGTTGITGVVSSVNSLVGSSAQDSVGSQGITTLSNGNYVVISPSWDNGATTDVGAVTFGSGLTGVSGVINTTNSALGQVAFNLFGRPVLDNINKTFITNTSLNGPVRVGSQVNGFVVFGPPNIYQSIAPPNTTTSVTNSNFGQSVASNSSYYVVGAPNVSVGGINQIGQGFVFSSTTGQLLRTLNNPSSTSLASMGQSVAITGDTVVLGAPFANVGSISAGRAMLFSASTGSLILTIDNPTPATNDTFGYTVAASGNFIAIAAEHDGTNGSNSGAVYIYNTAGVFQRTILNPFPTTGGTFGHALSLDGTTLAVGSGNANGVGEVYLYDVTTGVRQQTFTNPTSSTTDRFGDAVAVSGKKVAIGSYSALASGVRAGNVRVYDITAGTLLQTFTAPTPVLNDQFGFSLSFDVPFLTVGAPQTDIGGVNDVGAAYIFDVSTGLLKGGLSNPTPDSGDKFGTSVSIYDSKILVGSPYDDTKASDQGYVHVFSMVLPYTTALTGSSVPENSATGTVVGTFSSSATANSPVTYALVTGTGSTDNSKFVIAGNQLKTYAVLDFESQSTYSILVEATDNLGIKARSNWTVNATNVNESPTQLTISKSTVDELLPINSVLATFSTTDQDAGDTFTYQLTAGSPNDNSAFTIVGNTLRANQSFDYEAKDIYRIEVTSRDAGLLPIVRQFDITINDVNLPAITTQPRFDLRLVADIDNTIQSSNPESAVQLAGQTYFVASTPTYGKELFRTDLSVGGTTIVKDLVTATGDASPQSLTVYGNKIYFLASYTYIDPNAPPGGLGITRYGLWKTDGTEAGTELVKDLGLPTSSPSAAKPMVVMNNLLLFYTVDSLSGDQLWVTNGTTAGTQLIKTFPVSVVPISTSTSPASVSTGTVLFFNRNVDTSMGSHELWRTDGTAAGTYLLRQGGGGAPLLPPAKFDPTLVAIGNVVYFASPSTNEGLELWKSDGTVAGTGLFKDIASGPNSSGPTSLINVSGTLYFSADDGITGRELWKSDGTAAGTSRLKDIFVGTSINSGIDSDPLNANFVNWNNKLYFVANNGVNGTELWTSNGTSTGTQMVYDAGIGSQSLWPAKLVPLTTKMLVVTSSFGIAGQQLWVSDGTSSGTTVLSSSSGVSSSTSFYVLGSKAYFQGSQVATGNELWVSDGSVAGTNLVKDIYPGATSGLLGILTIGQNGVVLKVNDGVHGSELGYSDGTTTGTVVVDVALGTPSSNISEVVAQGSTLFISSSKGLYKSLGDAASTVQLSSKISSSLTVVGSKVYFVAPATSDSSDQELWVSDGTSIGTKLVYDVRTGASGSNPEQLTSFGGAVYFVANDGVHGKELWRSFGAALDPLSTQLVQEFGAGSADGNINRIMAVGSKLYVVANDKLYVENNGTFLLLASTSASSLMAWDNLLYFAGYSVDTGYELWRTDGTTLGTYLVSDIFPGPDSSYPGGGVVVSGVLTNSDPSSPGGASLEAKLIFRAAIANGSSQLFATNGTTAGTVALTNEPITTNSQGQIASLTPVSLTKDGGNVYFEGYRQDVGRELWVTNGTATGTHMVSDLRQGVAPDPLNNLPLQIPAFFNLRELTAFRNRLFFRTTSDAVGSELWSSDGTSTGSGLAIDIIPGTKSGFPTKLTVANDKLYLAANSNEYGVATNSVSDGELFLLNEAPYAFPVSGVTSVNQSNDLRLRAIDRDNDPTTFSITVQPQHGSVALNGSHVIYTPTNGYVGVDQFSYRVFDGSAFSDEAVVRVGVLASTQQTVSFSSAAQTIVEHSGVYVTSVTLSQPAAAVTLIPYSYGFGQTRTEGVVAFGVGATTGQIVIPLQDDNLHVSVPQQSLLEISLLPNEFVALGPNAQHVVTITDNDPIPVLFFVDPQRTYSETDGTIGFDVGLSNASDQVVTATISLSNSPTDYIAATQTLVTFQPGQTRQRVLVKLVNDSLPEPREVISSGIAAITNATITPDPNRFRSFAWIEDDDISKISLSPAVTFLIEGETVLLTATRTGGTLSTPLTVPYSVYLGGAVAADYSLSAPNFQFAANASTATVLVTALADGLAELFEAITIALNTNNSYVLDDSNQSYVGIYDNDRVIASLEFGATNVPGANAPHLIDENSHQAQNWRINVTAKLSTPSTQTISIPVVVNNGTQPGYATKGSDYLFDTSNFVFAPGVTQITRTLEILNDSVYEPDEKLQISLAPTATQLFLRKNGNKNDDGLTQQLTIRNDDYTASIDSPTSVGENSGTLNFTVSLNAVPSSIVDVDLQLSGTAKYQAVGFDSRGYRRLTFQTNSLSGPIPQSIVVPIQLIDNAIFEPKGHQLTMTAKVRPGQVIVSRTVTITDNESPPTVSFRKPVANALSLRNNSNALSLSDDSPVPFLIPLDLSVPSTTDTTVQVTFGGTAKRNEDYMVIGAGASGTATIPAGQSSTQIAIYPFDNHVVDGDKILEVNIAGTLAISIPADDRKITRTITEPSRSPSSNCYDDYPAYMAAVQAGALPDFSSATTSCLTDVTSSNPIHVVLSSIDVPPILPAGTLFNPNEEQGIIKDGHVFFDSNFNSIRDFLDLNQDGRQDENEPTEPESITDLSGSFAITVPASFDVDQSGFIEPREGRLVSYGGTDTATNLPWKLPMASPIGMFTVTPITTLLENLMRRASLSLDDAVAKITQSLSLGDFSLTSGASIYQVLANDPTAALAYSRQVAISSTAILAASLFSGKTGDDPKTYSDQWFDLLSNNIAQGTTKLDLSNSQLVGQLLSAVNSRLAQPLSTTVIDGATQLITLGIDRAQTLRLSDFADPETFLESLTRVKKLMHGDLANDLVSVGAGAKTIANVLATYTNNSAPNFDSLAASQVIGQIIPSIIGMSDATVREGQSGSKFMEFTVNLVGDHANTISVNYSTFDGSATVADGDYSPVSGVLTWAAGDTSLRTVQVPINGDTAFEIDEYIKLVLSNATEAVLRKQQGNGYIINDDSVSVSANSGGSQFSIEHGTEAMAILNDGVSIASGFFVDPVKATFTGNATNANSLTVNFSSDTYRGDEYTIVGGNANDTVSLLAGRFQTITHIISSGGTGTILAKPVAGDQSTIRWNSTENFIDQVSEVDEFIVHLPQEVDNYVIDDPDLNSTGQMRVRSSNGQFAPIVFTSPISKLSVVTTNPSAIRLAGSIDPGFTGTIEQLVGGVSLSTNSTAENQPIGSTVATFATQDPTLASGYTIAFIAGSGDTDNAAFAISGTSLLSNQSFDFETRNTYSVRIRTTGPSGNTIEQVLTINVANVNEAPTSLNLSNNSLIENAISNSTIGLLSASDPDAGDTLIFSLPAGQGDNAAFNISGSTLRANAPLNFESKSSYSVTIRVTDPGGLFKDLAATISVVDVPEMTQPVQIGDGTAQRSVIRQLVLNFDAPIVADSGAFIVQQRKNVAGNLVLDTVVTQAVLAPTVTGGTQVTLTFSGSLTNGFGALADGNYQLTIDGSKVRLLSNNMQFDGNNDGQAGGNYVLGAQAADNFFALFGDANGSGIVDTSDLLAANLALRKRIGQVGFDASFDFNNDGVIDTSELLLTRTALRNRRAAF